MLTIAEDEVKEGQLHRLEMGSKAVLVTKVNGKIYAMNNKCTHLGCSLSEGKLEGTIVTCPCHGTKFDITNGKAVDYVAKWPKIMGKMSSRFIKDEETFKVKVEGGQVQISK